MSSRERLQARLADVPLAFRYTHRADPLRVRPDTEVTIEGFPRSGNTFAVVALRHAQDRRIRLAHHRHSVGQLAETRRLRVPGLILLRDPRQAVASLLVREPGLSPDDVLGRYQRFHRYVQQHRDDFVLARFSTVSTDFGAVIVAVNERFGLSLRGFEHTADNVQQVFDRIDRISEQTGDASPHRSGRPHPGRRRALVDAQADLAAHRALRPCLDLYRELAADAV